MLSGLVCEDQNCKELIGRFQEYIEYDDVRFYLLKYMVKDLKEKKQQVSKCVSSKCNEENQQHIIV